MIVVAIVMVLAAIAVPNFYVMQLRTKRSEASINADGIDVAVMAYITARDDLAPGTGYNPEPVPPSKTLKDWLTATAFDEIPWSPDGQVRCTYRVSNGGRTTLGVCDLDADGDAAYYRIVRNTEWETIQHEFLQPDEY